MKKSDIHILVVDDDEGIQDLLQQIVEKAGYKVTAVGTPAEAENVIKLKTVHLAIIDCMLPIINGIDLAKKLKNSKLKNSPIILVSGVFRDEQFADDAMKKSGSDAFFPKPFDATALVDKVGELVSSLVDAKVGTLDSLLTKTEITKREAKKALDFLEDITGNDLIFALSILMRSKSSGYLTATDSQKNLTGFTLKDGEIIDVDTLKQSGSLKSLLLNKKLMADNEFEVVIQEASRKDPLGYLVKENFISPHMERIIKVDKIMEDLSRLFEQGSLDVSFSENRHLEASGVSINSAVINPLFLQTISTKIPLNWLKEFYGLWVDKVIQSIEGFDDHVALKQLLKFPDFEKLITQIKSKTTISELVSLSSEQEAYVLVHYLVVSRLICFANEGKMRNLNELQKRFEEIHNKIKGKNPFEIYHHFGAKKNPSEQEVERIYKEFAKASHPDKLPKSASPELVTLNNQVFSLVSDAHDVLVNQNKRQDLVDGMKEKEAKNQIIAEEKMEKSIPLLERGQFDDAWDLMSGAYKLHKNSLPMRLYYLWAKSKADPASLRAEANEIDKELNAVALEDKKSALFYFVSGLIAVLQDDAQKAETCFNRSLEFNENFISARRELMSLKNANKSRKSNVKPNTSDLLTGDITAIVSGLFKKKSG